MKLLPSRPPQFPAEIRTKEGVSSDAAIVALGGVDDGFEIPAIDDDLHH